MQPQVGTLHVFLAVLRGGPTITAIAMINNTREQQGEGWVLGTPSHRMVTATSNSQEDTVPQIGKINRLRRGCVPGSKPIPKGNMGNQDS